MKKIYGLDGCLLASGADNIYRFVLSHSVWLSEYGFIYDRGDGSCMDFIRPNSMRPSVILLWAKELTD